MTAATNPFLKMVPKKFSPFSVDSLLSHKEKAQRGKQAESVVKSEAGQPLVLGASNLASPPTSAEAMTKFLLNNNLFSQDGCDDSTKKNSPGMTNNLSNTEVVLKFSISTVCLPFSLFDEVEKINHAIPLFVGIGIGTLFCFDKISVPNFHPLNLG